MTVCVFCGQGGTDSARWDGEQYQPYHRRQCSPARTEAVSAQRLLGYLLAAG